MLTYSSAASINNVRHSINASWQHMFRYMKPKEALPSFRSCAAAALHLDQFHLSRMFRTSLPKTHKQQHAYWHPALAS